MWVKCGSHQSFTPNPSNVVDAPPMSPFLRIAQLQIYVPYPFSTQVVSFQTRQFLMPKIAWIGSLICGECCRSQKILCLRISCHDVLSEPKRTQTYGPSMTCMTHCTAVVTVVWLSRGMTKIYRTHGSHKVQKAKAKFLGMV